MKRNPCKTAEDWDFTVSVGIPVKANIDSGGKTNDIPERMAGRREFELVLKPRSIPAD